MRGGASKLYWCSRRDEVDVSSAQYFVNSSLALVLLLRRRVMSVADVHGFSHGRWDALLVRWKAVCDQGPCGPLLVYGLRGFLMLTSPRYLRLMGTLPFGSASLVYSAGYVSVVGLSQVDPLEGLG